MKRAWGLPSLRRVLARGAVSVLSAVAVVLLWCAFVEEAWHRNRVEAERLAVAVSPNEAKMPVELRVYDGADLAELVRSWERALEDAGLYDVNYPLRGDTGSGPTLTPRPTLEAARAFERMKALLERAGGWTDFATGAGTIEDWHGWLAVHRTPAAHARIARFLAALRAHVRESRAKAEAEAGS